MDGPAAPSESAGHLLPIEASRRQTGLQRRSAALLQLRAQGFDAIQPAASAVAPARTADGRGAHRSLQLAQRQRRLSRLGPRNRLGLATGREKPRVAVLTAEDTHQEVDEDP